MAEGRVRGDIYIFYRYCTGTLYRF